MEILRSVIVVLHLIGLAMILGPLLLAAVRGRYEFDPITQIGLGVALLTGVVLSAPFGDFDPNYPKIITKLVLLVVLGGVLGMGAAKAKKSGAPVAPGLFWAAIVLAIGIVSVAVIW